MLQILYFAWVREKIGKSEEAVRLPDDVLTVEDLLNFLSLKGDGYADALAERDRIRIAADQIFVRTDAALDGVKEVAIFPPVTGG